MGDKYSVKLREEGDKRDANFFTYGREVIVEIFRNVKGISCYADVKAL